MDEHLIDRVLISYVPSTQTYSPISPFRIIDCGYAILDRSESCETSEPSAIT
jgi:hypothetical protein